MNVEASLNPPSTSNIEIPSNLNQNNKNKNSTFNKDLLKIDLKKLLPHLTCYLCKGIFRTPITINECMDTFCKSCIFKEFHSKQSRTTCPKCNIDLGGKPMETMIFDNSLDSLIKILFPEFEFIDKENTEKMYEVFRNSNAPLPGDPSLDKKTKPSLSISILPYKADNSNAILPKLDSTKIQVARNMDIEKFKKYIAMKLNNQDCDVSSQELIIYFKNIEMRDDFNFDNIDKQYYFPLDNKIVFSYARKLNQDK